MPRLSPNIRACLTRAWHALPLVAATLLPVLLSGGLWFDIWRGERPRAWDGSGHFAVAKIYAQSIFPDTFGWTHAYFAGMPLPNFYPPLFYWCVALLSHTHLLSFPAAFKLAVCVPVLLTPAAVWAAARAVSGRSRLVAAGAAFACLPLLVDYRLRPIAPSGLDYVSTFQVGLYTQPLGFALLLCWLSAYVRVRVWSWRFALASALLALTVLANFFNAVIAAAFIAAFVVNDVVRWRGAGSGDEKEAERQSLLAHAAAPLVAGGLTLFWVVPMLSERAYFVTRPQVAPFFDFITPALWGWYALALAGFLCWLRRPTREMAPFLAVCVLLEAAIVLGSELAFGWFPLQPLRFLTTLNFLLTVPAGHAAAAAAEALAKAVRILSRRRPPAAGGEAAVRANDARAAGVALTLACAAGGLLLVTPPFYDRSFYPPGAGQPIDEVLGFARQHGDGRYLVEIPIHAYSGSMLDARALNSYLGAQGNEALSIVFREASPNALFFNPLVNVFSDNPDSFGLSSLLADDLDFLEQPLARHLERAGFVGVKYVVVATPAMKELLGREPGVAARHDLGAWSIFELRGPAAPRARVLPRRPALLVTDFSVKQRRREDYNFVRLAEEQFADGWFDVVLAYSTEIRIDRIEGLEQFGALVLDTYEADDQEAAFERLRRFAGRRPVVLLSSDSGLYRRILGARSDFPHAEFVERAAAGEPAGWLAADFPTLRYESSSIRREWRAIREALGGGRTPPDAGEAAGVAVDFGQAEITLRPGETPGEGSPVLVQTTYHPDWRRVDGQPVYAATPFFMLTFVRQPARLVYARPWFYWAGLWASALTLAALLYLTARRNRRPPRAGGGREIYSP